MDRVGFWLAGLVLLVPAPLGSATDAADGSGGGVFRWEAPGDLEGDLVLRGSFAVAGAADCSLRLGAGQRSDAATPALLMVYDDESPGPYGFIVTYPSLVQAHGGGLDTRDVLSHILHDTAGAVLELGVRMDHERTFTFMASNVTLHDWAELGGVPLFIEMDCGPTAPWATFRAGSRQMMVYAHTTMEGNGLTAPGVAAMEAHVEARFDTPEVLHVAQYQAGPVLLEDAQLRLVHPTGTRTFPLSEQAEVLDHGLGPAGTYRAELDATTVGDFLLWGGYGGLAPIDGVDDVLLP